MSAKWISIHDGETIVDADTGQVICSVYGKTFGEVLDRAAIIERSMERKIELENVKRELAEVTLLSESRLTLLNNQEQRHKAEIEDAKAKIELLKSMITSVADRIGDEGDAMWGRIIMRRLEEICKAKGGDQ